MRVLRPTDAPVPEGMTAPVGKEGTVEGFAPARGGTAWSVAIWLPDLEEVWSFDEDDLESTGVVEIEADTGRERVPLDPAIHERSFGAELSVTLYTEIQAVDAPARVAEAAENALRALTEIESVTWTGEVYYLSPYRYDLVLEVRTVRSSRDAFEAVVASRSSGWTYMFDDGWRCTFLWNQAADETGEPFLTSEAGDVKVDLTPWSDPSIHPVTAGRTHDPGLPGFTPPPP